ncbi:hypothetical protein C9374_002323 [Naegleria lovaniensis]|uniref:PHD finger protein 10 n=1 Tax=Naegleria lovaniensis TaxID=51637 RepID=A0AA88GUW0_NAELO|nr:uncharacterized protein C9374_002323 [Naegleria lovaniensis]KAG2386579.1 hypothetical protein C9374_002323 [Naegleria lovaniensis]
MSQIPTVVDTNQENSPARMNGSEQKEHHLAGMDEMELALAIDTTDGSAVLNPNNNNNPSSSVSVENQGKIDSPSIPSTRLLTPEEIMIMKRQREEVPFMLSSFPDPRTNHGYRAQFHTLCPYTSKLICYCNKFFLNSKQQQRFIHNTKNILEMYCSKRPEYAREVGFMINEEPTLNSSIIIAKDRIENVVNTYGDILESISSNSKTEPVSANPSESLFQLLDNSENTDSSLSAQEKQQASTLFSESELSQIPKKRGRPRSRKLCKKCDSGDQEDKLIHCVACNCYFHTFCHEPNMDHLEQQYRDNWLCADCKICLKCKKNSDESEMIICDYCDNAYHYRCLDPPLSEAPKGLWFCPTCQEQSSEKIEEFKKAKQSEAPSSTKQEQPSNEKKTKTPKKKKKNK